MSENETIKKQSKYDVPLWHKTNLSIEEAIAYTGIGRDKLYEMTNREDCPFVLWIGNRRLIKRKLLTNILLRCIQYSRIVKSAIGQFA